MLLQAISPLAGIVVIDVVEGSAIAALPFMTGVLNQRPASFGSLQEAIHWATSSGAPSEFTVSMMLRVLLLESSNLACSGFSTAALVRNV